MSSLDARVAGATSRLLAYAALQRPFGVRLQLRLLIALGGHERRHGTDPLDHVTTLGLDVVLELRWRDDLVVRHPGRHDVRVVAPPAFSSRSPLFMVAVLSALFDSLSLSPFPGEESAVKNEMSNTTLSLSLSLS